MKTMNKLKFKSIGILTLTTLLCCVFLTGCFNQIISSDFDKTKVEKAAKNVITLINNKDSDGIFKLCTVKMKRELTQELLSQIYDAISEGGKFEKVESMILEGTTDSSSNEEFAVVIADAKYEIRSFTYTISFSKQMKLAGLYYR